MTTEGPQPGPPGEGMPPTGGPPPGPAVPPAQPDFGGSQPPPPPPSPQESTAPGFNAGPAQFGGAAVKESNGAAVTSLIFGILAWLCIPVIGSIVAIITGVIGRKKQYQRGMATTGLWLGIVNLIVGLIATILAIIFVVVGVGTISEGTKVIPKSEYDFEITNCEISLSGVPSADFEITNRADEKRNFLVSIRFESTTSSESTTDSTTVSGVAPGATKSGSVTGFSFSDSDRGTCELDEVRNAFS